MGKGYVEVPDAGYQLWIEVNVPEDCVQYCRQKAEEMAKVFPELKVVGTSYFDGTGHAWCVTSEDTIVDPTAHQFAQQYPYREVDRLDIEDFPVGRCPQCGDMRWPLTENNKKRFAGSDELYDHKACFEQFKAEMEELDPEVYRINFG